MVNKIKLSQASLNPKWIDQNRGIRDNATFAGLEKTHSKGITGLRETAYALKAFVKNILLSPLFPAKHKTLKEEKSDASGLVVLFHGLNGKPSVWNGHVQKFEELAVDFPGFCVDLFTPEIPKKGHCALDGKELSRLYCNIAQWARNNPGKPIVLFGQSNGARIALHLEVLLRKLAPSNPVHLSSTGGVFYGTSMLHKLTQKFSPQVLQKLTLGLLTPIACEELKLGGEASKNLLDRARLPLEPDVAGRYYRKYCAVHDSHVREAGSALPILSACGEAGKVEKEYLVSGFGHNSIVDSVTEEQVAKAFHWIHGCNGEHTSKQKYAIRQGIHVVKGEDFVEVKDRRMLLQRIADIISAIFHALKTVVVRSIRRIRANNQRFVQPQEKNGRYSYVSEALPWTGANKSDGLYLFIHGLRGSPTDWDRYAEEVMQKDPVAHVFVPHVAAKGNCALEVAGGPLLEVVCNYLQKFPGRPIYLIGTSNGGRIATYIETHLDPAVLGNSSLKVASLSGVHNGTLLVNRIRKMGLSRLLRLDRVLEEEFVFGGRAAQGFMQAWQEKQRVWRQQDQSVRHLFCATTEDEQVRRLSSSLPNSQDRWTEHKISSGHSHTSIVDALRGQVIEWIQS